MKPKPRAYRGEEITVTYDVRRCIHAEECVHGLPVVFDPERRPWIDPDGASADQVAAVVRACPTGALRYEPGAGGEGEVAPESNTITLAADGPLYLHGDLELAWGPDGHAVRETRAALCRCGASANKPFCDNSHRQAGFADAGAAAAPMLAPMGQDETGALRVGLAANGPLLIQGPMKLRAAGGETAATGSKGALCRCGASANKPFCDGSHVAIGFEAEGS